MREVPLLARVLLGEWADKAAQLLVDDLPAIHAVANQVARVLLAHTEQLGATSPLVPPVARVWLRSDLADRYAGVFVTRPWYSYNVLGDHRVSPNFNVYLVKRGEAVYKVQLVDYYGPAGETRRITVRYEQIAG